MCPMYPNGYTTYFYYLEKAINLKRLLLLLLSCILTKEYNISPYQEI